MQPSFFEQFPTARDLGNYLKAKPEAAGATVAQYLAAHLPKESAFQSGIIKAVREWMRERRISQTAFLWKESAGVYHRNGLPDLMMICDGRFFGFEVKRPYIGKPTALQEKTIKDINEAGGRAAIVSYPSEVKAILMKAGVWRGEA